MIAACPKCQTRYRVEADRLGPDGARLRCSRCSAVFRVRLPESTPQSVEAPATVPAAPTPVAAPAAPQAQPEALAPPRPRASAEDAPRFDRARLVLVAHPDPDACKRLAEALEASGLQVLVAHDGVEAMLTIQRALPRAVALDAALPKMFGFQVCEIVKRNESLRATQVCLMGAIHKEDRYRRAPNEIYGADFYCEPPSLPGALIDWLGRIGLPLRSRVVPSEETLSTAPVQRSQEPAPASAGAEGAGARSPSAREAGATHGLGTSPSEAPASEAHTARAGVGSVSDSEPIKTRAAAPADTLSAERAQAERLARIIVSDIILYNEEKFTAAVRSGGVLEALRDELAEGRALFCERIDPRVREERDYLADELVRVARGRGMP
jgi:predicted Zn finger-like uncharacterized protein